RRLAPPAPPAAGARLRLRPQPVGGARRLAASARTDAAGHPAAADSAAPRRPAGTRSADAGAGGVSPTRVILSSFPERASPRDYAEAAAELEGLLVELPGALAVYRFGNVGAPGISDLDRLVVVERPDAVPDVWNRLSA